MCGGTKTMTVIFLGALGRSGKLFLFVDNYFLFIG
jgi:hypothetical protein